MMKTLFHLEVLYEHFLIPEDKKLFPGIHRVSGLLSARKTGICLFTFSSNKIGGIWTSSTNMNNNVTECVRSSS